MSAKQIVTPEHLVHLDQGSVFLYTNRHHGNVAPKFGAEAKANQQRALAVLAGYTTAQSLVAMTPNHGRFVDLDVEVPAATYEADALITTNPEHVLHVRPADCGTIAVRGFGANVDAEVLALFHVSRHIAESGAHLRAFEHAIEHHGIDPSQVSIFVGPSARKESYKFPSIDEAQKRANSKWHDYVYEDEDGFWHVDFHQRAVDNLMVEFGVDSGQVTVSDIDTAASPDYFSHMRFNKGIDPVNGRNGAFFALATS